jgi:hypothetical protein
MLNRKLVNITNVMSFNLTNTINQVVTTRVVSLTDCRGRKLQELSRNYLITGYIIYSNS